MLGNLLGEVIEEQEGSGLFELEERIRLTSKRLRRRFDSSIQRTMKRMVRAMEPAEMAKILRAFVVYFQLSNTAEQH
jgi:phosphoenolpyruvate carboxylase